MKKEDRINKVVIPFVTNFLAVALGIVITFTVQGLVDKKNKLNDINSGLALVKKELASNIDDLRFAKSDLESMSYSAQYLYDRLDNLNSCPKDSVNIHWENLKIESYLTLPDDALQMLKDTYLYSPMLDREVSLAIVRAYDICDALQNYHNSTIERKTNTIEKLDDLFTARATDSTKEIDLKTLLNSHKGRKLLLATIEQDGSWIERAVQDIEETIALIDSYISE